MEMPADDSKKMESFQGLMNYVQDENMKYVQNLAKELNISEVLLESYKCLSNKYL